MCIRHSVGEEREQPSVSELNKLSMLHKPLPEPARTVMCPRRHMLDSRDAWLLLRPIQYPKSWMISGAAQCQEPKEQGMVARIINGFA